MEWETGWEVCRAKLQKDREAGMQIGFWDCYEEFNEAAVKELLQERFGKTWPWSSASNKG